MFYSWFSKNMFLLMKVHDLSSKLDQFNVKKTTLNIYKKQVG
ncbi:hypothetical protein LLB_3561 [Legionella longbeachae D-4968]|nr:hypothetical protein LLB_3561 [Legionella longbeachae D-4968]